MDILRQLYGHSKICFYEQLKIYFYRFSKIINHEHSKFDIYGFSKKYMDIF